VHEDAVDLNRGQLPICLIQRYVSDRYEKEGGKRTNNIADYSLLKIQFTAQRDVAQRVIVQRDDFISKKVSREGNTSKVRSRVLISFSKARITAEDLVSRMSSSQ